MPFSVTEKRAHRGPHPKDAKFFSARAQSALREATGDLCWLLSRDYSLHSASELVGNRYELSRRQRMAISRCACSPHNLESRRQRQVQPNVLQGEELWIDGYNVLMVVEVALGGGTGPDRLRRLLPGCGWHPPSLPKSRGDRLSLAPGRRAHQPMADPEVSLVPR